MTLVRNSLMSNMSGRRTAVFTAGERQVDTFDPVIAIPATEPSTALHSWTYTTAMLPTLTNCHSFVRAPMFNIHVRNTAEVAVALSYRIKVNSTSVITGSFNTHATSHFTTLRLGFNGARNMVAGDEVELFLWCATAGMNLTSSILDTYATRVFLCPPRAGVYNVTFLTQFVGVGFPALEAEFSSMTTQAYVNVWLHTGQTIYNCVSLVSGVRLALLADATYGVLSSSYGDLTNNGVSHHTTVYFHARPNTLGSIIYTPLTLDIDPSLLA